MTPFLEIPITVKTYTVESILSKRFVDIVLSATRATLTETTVRFKGVFHDFRSFRLGFGLVHCPVSGCFSGE
jgi:hypothetical protein